MSALLELVRSALAGEDAWVVGGAVRDELQGRRSDDLDLAVPDADAARRGARAIARAAGGHAFALSDAFGAWRATGPGSAPAWQVDLTPLQGADLAADLARRDLTVNAIARPLAGGPLVDPHGGAADLAAGRLRLVGPDALAADPVRVLRLARFAAQLGAEVEPSALAAARAAAPGLSGVPGERLLPELARILVAAEPERRTRGLDVAARSGALAALLPDAADDDGALAGGTTDLLAAVLDGEALRHVAPDARVALAARLADPDRRLAVALGVLLRHAADPDAALAPWRPSQRLRDRVGRLAAASRTLDAAALARLARPPSRGPVALAGPPAAGRARRRALLALGDVAPEGVLLAAAAGDATSPACDPQLDLLGRALRWGEHPPRPPVDGGRLAEALGLPPGPLLGLLLEELTWRADDGEVADAEAALALARALREGAG
ncbi:hypothetical protein SK069_04735 [Patulibacter brassicae]|uniref:CCA tRNA nucleotidyltransferase n=1 Tax=Patulibacter brassicae TaxID=1705717 RepID=A0ABU4VJA0_9ACTN|nr:hypothetical protein [Patulibacter brassicae]MDX8150890.1 hypothetical protein [Patulibacter brassicae]